MKKNQMHIFGKDIDLVLHENSTAQEIADEINSQWGYNVAEVREDGSILCTPPPDVGHQFSNTGEVNMLLTDASGFTIITPWIKKGKENKNMENYKEIKVTDVYELEDLVKQILWNVSSMRDVECRKASRQICRFLIKSYKLKKIN